MSIKSLLFDFDGLILDTETSDVEAWRLIYAEYGFEYPKEYWSQIVGGWGASNFDAAEYLHQLTQDSLDVASLRRRHEAESDALILRQPILEGVEEYLRQAPRLGLRLAIASSSPHAWIDKQLSRLGLTEHFEKIICGDDVPPGHTKPQPDIYRKVLDELKIPATAAIALEDSPNGVLAAHAVGIFVVAVPNATTSQLKIEGADLTVPSLASLALPDLLKRAATPPAD